MSALYPYKCTGIIHLVFSVITSEIVFDEIQKLFSSISANTGVDPTLKTASKVAT